MAIAACTYAAGEGWRAAAGVLGTLAGIAALFNVANLVPVWKFDGGQVLRQICPGPATLALASFALLSAFLALGYAADFPAPLLVVAGAIFAILSLITAGSGVKPRHELKPIRGMERIAIAGALIAVFVIHASAFCGPRRGSKTCAISSASVTNAISLPHMLNRFGPYDLEEGTRAEGFADELEALGYKTKIGDQNSGLHGIAITPDGLTGGADPGREGVALGD